MHGCFLEAVVCCRVLWRKGHFVGRVEVPCHIKALCVLLYQSSAGAFIMAFATCIAVGTCPPVYHGLSCGSYTLQTHCIARHRYKLSLPECMVHTAATAGVAQVQDIGCVV